MKAKFEFKRIKAVIIGGAWDGAIKYEQKLMALGEKKCGENIYFLGTRSDVPELYADIDLVVHPSYSENLGGAAESLLLGIPTISSNVGGFPDIVIHKETGYLVNPGKPEEIASAVEYALNNYDAMKEMAIAGEKKVGILMDVNRTGKEMFWIYNKILTA